MSSRARIVWTERMIFMVYVIFLIVICQLSMLPLHFEIVSQRKLSHPHHQLQHHIHTLWSTVRNRCFKFYLTASPNINSSPAPTTFDHSTQPSSNARIWSIFCCHHHSILFRTILFGLRFFINLISNKNERI